MVPPESVELLENNKGEVISLHSEEQIIDIKDCLWNPID